jgi:hypothetical protein
LDVENFKFWKYVRAKSFRCIVKYLKIKNKASIASSSSAAATGLALHRTFVRPRED